MIKKLMLLCLFSWIGMNFVSAQTSTHDEYRILAVSNSNPDLLAVSNEVKVALPLNLKVPTAFSPNGDGLNDSFGILSEGIQSFRITIYDRWGNVIFQANQPEARWDGTLNGQRLPEGVYAYEIAAKNGDNQSMHKKGSVTLIN